jgi:hypothetical protein
MVHLRIERVALVLETIALVERYALTRVADSLEEGEGGVPGGVGTRAEYNQKLSLPIIGRI